MIRITKIVTFLSIISLAFCEAPSWVAKRPVDKNYFFGIGTASKSSSNYIQSAKNNALSDLSSEISINISSELVDIMVERSGMNEEESRSEIHALTKADL